MFDIRDIIQKTYFSCAVLPFFILHPPYYRIVKLIYIELSAMWLIPDDVSRLVSFESQVTTQASLKWAISAHSHREIPDDCMTTKYSKRIQSCL